MRACQHQERTQKAVRGRVHWRIGGRQRRGRVKGGGGQAPRGLKSVRTLYIRMRAAPDASNPRKVLVLPYRYGYSYWYRGAFGSWRLGRAQPGLEIIPLPAVSLQCVSSPERCLDCCRVSATCRAAAENVQGSRYYSYQHVGVRGRTAGRAGGDPPLAVAGRTSPRAVQRGRMRYQTHQVLVRLHYGT